MLEYENNNMINDNGNKKYAYITMIIKNESYASGGIVLAESIRKLGSLADLVVMIDDTITENTEDLLKKFYDKIIRINVLDIENENKIQKIILTKLEALKLVEYEKIIIIDVDCIIFNNIDNIFSKKCPACINIDNKINTGLLLLKPDYKEYEKFINILNNEKMEKKIFSEKKPLIFILEKLYKNINKLDKTFLNSNEFKESDGIQYNVNKPFLMESTLTIENRMNLDIFKIWYYYFLNILNKYPEIKNYSCLKETLEISKYFLSSVSRYIVTYRNIKKFNNYNQIKKLYKITKNNNLDFYHINISKEYDNENINLNDYACTNFIEYLKIKTNLFDNINNYNNINSLIKNISDEQLLDYILSEYIRLHDNVFVILLIDENNENHDNNLKNEDINNIIFEKEFVILGIILKNILFNINQNYVYNERVLFLSNNYKDYIQYKIKLLVYQTIYPLDIENTNNSKILILKDTNSKIRLSSILLNNNSMKRFVNKNINFIKEDKINKKNIFKLLNFQTLKKWIYNTWSGNELSFLIIIKDKLPILIDTITSDPIKIKKIIDKKVEIFEIIFSKSSIYKKKAIKYINIINNVNNPKYYWELEGIKFGLLNFDY